MESELGTLDDNVDGFLLEPESHNLRTIVNVIVNVVKVWLKPR